MPSLKAIKHASEQRLVVVPVSIIGTLIGVMGVLQVSNQDVADLGDKLENATGAIIKLEASMSAEGEKVDRIFERFDRLLQIYGKTDAENKVTRSLADRNEKDIGRHMIQHYNSLIVNNKETLGP